jgi:hypothetical protein
MITPIEVTSNGTEVQPPTGEPVNHDNVIDPVADLMSASTLISVTDRVKEWLDRFKSLTWSPDEAPDSLQEAFKAAKELDLAVQTVVRRGKDRRPVSLLQWVYHHFRPACGSQKEAETEIRDAIDETQVRHDGVAKDRLELPNLYFDRDSGRYWRELEDGYWQAEKESDTHDLLVEAGVSREMPKDLSLSDVDRHLLNVRNEHGVDWAGPLAGHPTGPQVMLSNQILVTRSFRLIEPVEGDWTVIEKILVGMLGKLQVVYFYATLKIFYEALRDGRSQPGQMIVFCGPRDCLKSFVQHEIITPVWGGRCADAARYLMGRTEFNAELCGAEHLFLDDAKPYGNWLSRHDFAENLKNLIVGKVIGLHGKHKSQINVRIRQRVTMSINHDETALRSLPDISESFEDKVHLFLCKKFTLPMPNQTPKERAAFEEAVSAALPAFVYSLMEWDIPKAKRGVRFGVKYYHNRQLLAKVEAMSGEARLDEIIENVGLVTCDGVWRGTAANLYGLLTDHQVYGKQAAKLLLWDNATGSLLGRLAKKKPTKYMKNDHKVNGKTTRGWAIRLDNAREDVE